MTRMRSTTVTIQPASFQTNTKHETNTDFFGIVHWRFTDTRQTRDDCHADGREGACVFVACSLY